MLVAVDNVHNTGISNIFSLIKKLRDDNEDEFKQIKFLLSARQPEFGWAKDRGLFDTDTVNRIDMFFEKEKEKYITTISNFELPEVQGFIEKYKGHLHDGIKHKSIQDNTNEIFKDTKGHPIMVRFSALNNGLKSHVRQMYKDYLLENNSLGIERIKSVILCSLYDISSIPLTETTLFSEFDLKSPSLEIINTIIKRTGNFWTTLHPRWDLELFEYMFSLNEADRIKIQEAFHHILSKILDISKLIDQVAVLDTLYNTVASKHYIDIDTVKDILSVSEIENKFTDPFVKVVFLSNVVGFALYSLGRYDEAIKSFDEAIGIKLEDATAHYLKGLALSDLGRKDEAIKSYDEAIKLNPKYANAYGYKGNVLSALGRNEEAIECYDAVIRRNPDDAKAYYNKGLALSALGRNEEAIRSYDEAVRINPEYAASLLQQRHQSLCTWKI